MMLGLNPIGRICMAWLDRNKGVTIQIAIFHMLSMLAKAIYININICILRSLRQKGKGTHYQQHNENKPQRTKPWRRKQKRMSMYKIGVNGEYSSDQFSMGVKKNARENPE